MAKSKKSVTDKKIEAILLGFARKVARSALETAAGRKPKFGLDAVLKETMESIRKMEEKD